MTGAGEGVTFVYSKDLTLPPKLGKSLGGGIKSKMWGLIPLLPILLHSVVGFALQSLEDCATGGEFHPGEPPFPPFLLPNPTCHGIMGDSDSVSACQEFSIPIYSQTWVLKRLPSGTIWFRGRNVSVLD